jgi:HK97 family phage prohead protease
MKTGIKALTSRLSGGEKRIAWREEDIPQLAKMYGVPVHRAMEIWQQKKVATSTSRTVAKAAVQEELPTRWQFTASDGTKDRAGDIVLVEGIKLDAYHKNPVWTWQHDYSRPIGRSIKTWKENGKLKSIVELAVGVLPDADMVQNMLVKKMLSACSISFTPIKWRPMKDGSDGILFSEIDLQEIGAVTVPCARGATLDGPVKSLTEQAAEYRQQAKADMAAIAKAKREEEIEARMASTTPAQRKREREAALLQIRGRQ